MPQLVPLIAYHLPRLRTLCRRYKFHRVWVFGSATDPERFHAGSDVDFLWQMDLGIVTSREFLDHPLLMERALSATLGRKVDFVPYQYFRNPYFREAAEASKYLIYERSEAAIEISGGYTFLHRPAGRLRRHGARRGNPG
jgi:predicted nucleotidyltransferase